MRKSEARNDTVLEQFAENVSVRCMKIAFLDMEKYDQSLRLAHDANVRLRASIEEQSFFDDRAVDEWRFIVFI